MARAESRQALGHVTLVTGPEEFLGERAVQAVRAQVRRHDADAELSETDAATLTMAVLGDLAAPSLFSSIRCVVVRRLEELPEESVPGLLAYAGAPADDVALVLAHGGGQKGSGVLTRLRKLERVVEIKSASLRPSELPGFVGQELRGHGARIEPDAAEFLVQAVGQDLRSLAAAAHQLASDFEGTTLTTEIVKRYFGGRARPLRAGRQGAGGAALGAGARHRAGPGHKRARGQPARAGALHGRPAGDARQRPGPRGGGAAVEDRRAAPPVARLGRRRRGTGHPLGRPRGRRRQGPGERPGVRAGEDGARRGPRAAAALSAISTKPAAGNRTSPRTR